MINIPFLSWFLDKILIGGDWRFFWPENLKEIIGYSYAWDSSLNTGLGHANFTLLWLNTYLAFAVHLVTQILHIPWGIGEKVVFFWPIFFLSFFSSFFLSKRFIKSKLLQVLSGIIYLSNTYALMVFSGGQVGIALAYSIVPFVFLQFISLVDSCAGKNIWHLVNRSIFVGLTFSLQILFEPRIFYVTFFIVFLFFVYSSTELNLLKVKTLFSYSKRIILFFVLPFIVVFCLHSFWILPLLVYRYNPAMDLGQIYTSLDAVKFFSFATFSQTISLLHPNWPENIFGKVYFMRPEFLLIPLFALSYPLFLKDKETRKKIIFFVLLTLLSSFLAKGAQEPFGGIYLFLFQYLPGMQAFRDATKWYIPIALSYAILIPFFIENVTKQKLIKTILPVIIFAYWIFLLFPAFTGQVKGTFAQREIPKEYIALHDFLVKENGSHRTLWVPSLQRFGYFSNDIPALHGKELLGEGYERNITKKFDTKETLQLLQSAGIKYVILPYDSEGEIFLTDRKYDDRKYEKTKTDLTKVSWLAQKKIFGKIIIFEVPSPNDRFFAIGKETAFTWERINPTYYKIRAKSPFSGTLVFSEKFNGNWKLFEGVENIASQKYSLFNSFTVKNMHEAEIHFLPQQYVRLGQWISISFLLAITLYLAYYSVKRNKQ